MRRPEELERCRIVLEAKRTELMASLRRRDSIVVEKAAEDMDNLQLAGQRELAVSHLHMEFTVLRDVVEALSRIQDGSYGICLQCEKPISPKRLRAVPWAACCVRCQEASDRGVTEEETALNLPDAA